MTLNLFRVPGYPVMVGYPVPYSGYPGVAPGTGSLRSVQSVPMLHPVVPMGGAMRHPASHTLDREPCAVIIMGLDQWYP